MPVRVRLLFELPPDVMQEVLQDAIEAGNTAALLYWHENFRPRHFTPEAMRLYGYQPRSGDNEPPQLPYERTLPNGSVVTRYRANPHYSWVKRRRMRHNNPLVWSGASREASNQIRIDTAGNTAKLAFTALPNYFFQNLKAGTYYRRGYSADGTPTNTPFTLTHDTPNKSQELVIVREDEAQTMGVIAEKTLESYLQRARSLTEVLV